MLGSTGVSDFRVFWVLECLYRLYQLRISNMKIWNLRGSKIQNFLNIMSALKKFWILEHYIQIVDFWVRVLNLCIVLWSYDIPDLVLGVLKTKQNGNRLICVVSRPPVKDFFPLHSGPAWRRTWNPKGWLFIPAPCWSSIGSSLAGRDGSAWLLLPLWPPWLMLWVGVREVKGTSLLLSRGGSPGGDPCWRPGKSRLIAAQPSAFFDSTHMDLLRRLGRVRV